MKTCSKCNNTKDLNKYHKAPKGKFGVKSVCKDCCAEIAQKYKENPKNLETIKNARKNWKQSERGKKYSSDYSKLEHIKERRNNYKKEKRSDEEYKSLENQKNNIRRKNNREKINNQRKDRRKKDCNFKLVENLRNRIRKAINNIDKSQKTIDLVGCSIEMLKNHISQKFTEGMNWDNYGEWHIDHIKPCASFDLSKKDEQEKCFHFSNLQPLWAIENLKKGSK